MVVFNPLPRPVFVLAKSDPFSQVVPALLGLFQKLFSPPLFYLLEIFLIQFIAWNVGKFVGFLFTFVEIRSDYILEIL